MKAIIEIPDEIYSEIKNGEDIIGYIIRNSIPFPKGYWIAESESSLTAYYCSNCKNYYTSDWEEMKYCPNCGAEMRGKQNADSD